MGMQDRDYFWEHRDKQARASRARSVPRKPFITADMLRSGSRAAQPDIDVWRLLGRLFVAVCAGVGFVVILGWFRHW